MSDDVPPPPPPPSPDPVPSAPPPAPEPVPPSSGALPPGPAYGSGKLSASDDKTFCILSHVLGIVAGFLAPLIFWLIKKDESPAVAEHAKESLNFQLNVLVYLIVIAIISCGMLTPLPWIYSIVMCVIATMKASEGQLYRYPAILRVIK